MFAHSVLYFLVRAGNGILGILTLSVFAHTLSPAEYGAYALAVSTSAILCAVGFHWLSVAVGRFYPLYRDNPEIVISSASRGFWLATVAVVLVAALAFSFGVGFGVSPSVLLLLVALAIVQGRYNIILQIANAQGAPLTYGLMTWVKAAVGLLSGWALVVVAGIGERGALLGLLVGTLVIVTACDPGWRSRRVPGPAARELSEKFFRYGLPLTVTSLATVAVDVADRFMIGWMLGLTHVAPYSVAYDLVQQSIGMLLGVMFLAAFPVIVRRLKDNGDVAVRIHLQQLASAYFAIGIPAATGLAVLADDIAAVVFGDALANDAASVVPWLSCAILIGSLKSYFLDIPFQLRHATASLGYVALGMVAVNIAANLLLIPRFGILGCAWATVAAFLSGSLASWYYGRRLLLLPWPATDLIKAGFGSLIMAAGLGYVSLPPSPGSLMLKVLVGGTVYAILATVLNIGGLRAAVGDAFRQAQRDRK
jgi:O-antigen/teichoic acid export membrane protein